ncbi:MAG TPA: DUF5666 domain-containing protein [Blastococcus sp.]|nr:DUF5666 domain-containing protein [Blastococcus sp.]
MSVFRALRALIVGGVAAAVALGGAGLAYASSDSSAKPSAAASSPTKSTTPAKGRKLPAEDLVTGINGTSLTADTPKGPKTFTLTSSTTYRRGNTKLTEADIKAGELVRIRTAKGGTTAKSVAIAPAVLTGYVQSLSGSTLTVLDRSGFSHQVSTTGATYKKNGAAGQASDVAVGRLVRVQGFIDANGSTVDASTIGVRQP